ncbi:aldo/keto reductase [Streptomyces olivaceus]|uniref:aldo/keto reductase n=1 Tax=Streptomyces olivaceus TaxID=47716 RepID=UPI001CCD3FA6|nr:aldo/keto reductase [Streptomyces olivaceus]MBZ6231487.1 aldo/keto reductase [Streptomyces olivaceus]
MVTAPAVALPNIPVALSPLVLGTMTFGDTVDRAEAARLLDMALDAGITGVDTANVYAGGATESILGELLPKRRDRVVLATKAGIAHPDQGGHAPLSRAGLRAALEGSLRRLGTDHVDLFYLHQPDHVTPPAETMAAVAELAAEGRFLALGVSNHAAWRIADLMRLADELAAPRPVIAQQLHNLLARRIEEEFTGFAAHPAAHGLRTVAYNALAGGLLTGRYQEGRAPGAGRFGTSRLASAYQDRYWHDGLFAAVARLRAVADGAGIPLAALALRWLLHRESTDAVLIGCSGAGQLRANLEAAAAGPLPDDVLGACDEVGADLRGPMPAYHR